jgi:hypothetical protein
MAGDPVNQRDPTGLSLYAFDGTENTPEDMTNVFKLGPFYRGGQGRFYLEGVGTSWYNAHDVVFFEILSNEEVKVIARSELPTSSQ